jgi:hypothetical protein
MYSKACIEYAETTAKKDDSNKYLAANFILNTSGERIFLAEKKSDNTIKAAKLIKSVNNT